LANILDNELCKIKMFIKIDPVLGKNKKKAVQITKGPGKVRTPQMDYAPVADYRDRSLPLINLYNQRVTYAPK
jgi:hypothetical protein